jgi:hypothetical protein
MIKKFENFGGESMPTYTNKKELVVPIDFSKEEFLEYFNKVARERMTSKDLYMYVDDFIAMTYPPKRKTWKEHLKDPNGPWNWNKTPEEKKNDNEN